MSGHPSFLQLDRLASGLADAETSRHARACSACSAHLARVAPLPSTPEWARALPPVRGPWWRRLLAGRAKWLPAAACGLALAGAVAVVALPRAEPVVSAKGSPSVAVYVKRGGRVFLWDGRAPLRAGDAVQLKVQPESFAQLVVAEVGEPGGDMETLYSSEMPQHQATLLPQSFTLDRGPTALLFVFSQAALTRGELEASARQLPRTQRVWTTRLELTKGDAQ